MGCFLGCFGLSSKRKRRKYRVHKLGSYEPLDSASTNIDATAGNPITSEAELSRRPKELLNKKVRKKVSFNLNVQTYEPLPKDESTNNYWGSEEDEKKEDAANETQSSLSQEDSMASKMATYPSNYRYRNCIDSYEEEDDIAYQESDMDDEDDDDDEDEFDEDDDNNCCDCNIDELRVGQNKFSGQFSYSSLSSHKRNSFIMLGEDTNENLNPLGDSNERGLGSHQNLHSVVLKPVENLRQWNAVKRRGGQPPLKQQRKENVAFEKQSQKPLSSILNFSHSTPLMQEIAVDASLSNWLVPLDSYQKKAASIMKSNTSNVETKPSKQSSFYSPYAWKDRNVPILGITNLKA